nr:pyrroline-5-carboxylate reductase [bacterium]
MISFGIIGAGNMGGAIARRLACAGYPILVYDPSPAAIAALTADAQVTALDCPQAVASQADLVLIAVKPGLMDGVLADIAPCIRAAQPVISIAAGYTTARMEKALCGHGRPLRAMPNTPAMVGQGMICLSQSTQLDQAQRASVADAFECLGRVAWVPEGLMEAVTAVSGSGPAYAYMFIEALADGGVQQGLPYPLALEAACQTVLGAATMVLESGSHPGALRSAVCSPAGTTIEAVAVLEREGLRSAIMQAVAACADKAREMGREKPHG